MGNFLNIRIGHLKIIDHLILGISLPETQGTFLGNPAKMEIQAVAMSSWDQISQGLKDGDIAGGFITAPLAMDLFEAGLDISLLMFTHRSGSLLVYNRAAGVQQIQDFMGKTILIPHRLCVQHMLLHKFMAAKGMNLKLSGETSWDDQSIWAEPVPPGLMPEMLEMDEDGDITAFMSADPFGTLAIEKGNGKRLLTSQDLWKNHPCCCFVIKSDLLNSHGDELQELVRLFFESARTLDTQLKGEGPMDDMILDQAAFFLEQSRDIICQALENSGITYSPNLLVPEKTQLDIIQTYMNTTMKILPHTIDLDAFIKPAFADKALAELVP